MGRGPAELRDNKLDIGGGLRYSLEELELTTLHERIKGKIWYVDSNVTAGRSGNSWGSAFTTMNEADLAALADDFVVVAPAHVETVVAVAGLGLNTAGVTWLGLGNGDRKPQIDFTTVVGADMNIGGAGVTMYNFRLTGGIDALTGPLDVNAADFAFIDCITEDVTGQATDFIATDANADRMKLVRWTHRGATGAGADTAISIVGGTDIVIEDAWVDGNFAVSAIENVTTNAVNLALYGGMNRPCYLRTRNNADVVFTARAGTTGNVGPYLYCRLQQNASNITEALVGAGMQFMQPCYIVNANGERNIETNIAVSAG